MTAQDEGRPANYSHKLAGIRQWASEQAALRQQEADHQSGDQLPVDLPVVDLDE